MSTNPRDIKGLAVIASVVAEALESEEARRRLIDDPAAVLTGAGLVIPEGVKVVVHENTEDTFHLVLPSRPGPEQELDLDDLDPGTLARFWPY